MKLSEIVDIDELRGICEDFTALTGAVTAILDLEGNILISTGWRDMCSRFHRVHPTTARRCRESDTILAGQLGCGEQYNVYKCKNGLIDVAVPIIVDGSHVANLFTGQFLFDAPDVEYFIRQAEDMGFDKDAYLDALSHVPIFSQDRIKALVSFFSRLVGLIGKMGRVEKIKEKERTHLHAVLETIPDMMWLKDSQGFYITCNLEFESLFGASESEIVGKTDYDFVEKELADFFRQKDMSAIEAGKPCVNEEWVTYRSDGHRALLETIKTPMIDPSGNLVGILGIARDITGHKAAEARIQRLSNLYAALSQCNEAIVRCKSEEELFPLICRAAVQFGGMQMAWIGFVDKQSKRVEMAAAYGDESGYLDDLHIMVDATDPFGCGPTGMAIRDDRPVWCQDFLSDPATAPWHARAGKAGFRSSASLPLHRNGVPDGCLTLYGKSVDLFDDDARRLLVEMAMDISFALDNFAREAERAQALEAVRVAEEQFRGLVEQSIAGIYIIQGGQYVYANPRLAEILGYDSTDELIGGDPLAAFSAKGSLPEGLREMLEGNGSGGSFTVSASRKDGTLIHIGLHGARATNAGRPAIIGLVQDISEKLRAEEKNRLYLGQLERAFRHVVMVATNLSELRDPYTAGHERRVGRIARGIAEELGLDEKQVEGVEVAGYLHDLGKITIPAEILTRPGHLSDVEFTLIKGHAEASFNVLKDAEFPWPIAEIALQHHERLDGSGYPRGLKGNEILLEARILAVADVIEAMASHRPYRPSLGIDRALAEIKRGCGTIYDPAVVQACVRLFRDKGFIIPD